MASGGVSSGTHMSGRGSLPAIGICRSGYLNAADVQMRCGPLSKDEIDQAIKLYDTGLSLAAVGKQLSRDHAGI
jgi:hypothetical protein